MQPDNFSFGSQIDGSTYEHDVVIFHDRGISGLLNRLPDRLHTMEDPLDQARDSSRTAFQDRSIIV